MSRIVKTSVAVVSLLGFLLALLLSIYAAFSWIVFARNSTYITPHPSLLMRLLTPMILTAISLACVLVTVKLIRGRRWAWWGAAFVSVTMFGFGIFVCWTAFHPRDAYQESEGAFVLLSGIMVFVPALVSGVLLNLPTVRRNLLHPKSAAS
jgi:hypothetical protein